MKKEKWEEIGEWDRERKENMDEIWEKDVYEMNEICFEF